MGIFKTITEGGQIWAHRVRMAKQVLKIASFVSLVLGIAFFYYRLSQIPLLHYQAAQYYLSAKILNSPQELLSVDGDVWGKLTGLRTSHSSLSLKAETIAKVCRRPAVLVGKQFILAIQQTMTFSSYAFITSLFFFFLRGWRARQKEHIEGKKIISGRKLALKLILTGQASPIRLGPIPLIKGTETHHILVSGATGTGKTTAFHTLLPQIRKHRQKAIIVDLTGEFVEKY
ncbi:MAG TPA: type IV secretion system DNA-binding domain-containing protein, partial [Candidatus Babeliaceae bacterium]|nr:type IV secretion system DNA-binding domain-containing protein [Candidatus Babeliaceae bacterium]